MQDERDVLVKKTFPLIRKLCLERGVTFLEIDLRWGITREQSERGQVLETCLSEIDACRPYFIGLLGERYGSTPARVDLDVFDRFPSIAGHASKSITELEIVHGVFGNPDIARRAFFYFRDPRYVTSVPPTDRHLFLSDTDDDAQKLATLKSALRELAHHGKITLREYACPTDLSACVYDDLCSSIDDDFPATHALDPFEQERLGQDAFVEHRTKVFVGRERELSALRTHLASHKPLVVFGGPGSGKSSLLAMWSRLYAETNRGARLITYFAAASSARTTWSRVAWWILHEAGRLLNADVSSPFTDDRVRKDLFAAIERLGSVGPLLMIIDGLDEIDASEMDASALKWLPAHLPPTVTLVVSTASEIQRSALQDQGWASLAVGPFDADERQRFVQEYLWQMYRKRLGEEERTQITRSSWSGNPLFLKLLLEELRVFGRHERLTEVIKSYLDSCGVVDLVHKVLQRLERDYDVDRPNLVRDAATLLLCARNGLSEHEIVTLLGDGGRPLAAAHWAPLRLALGESLINRSGYLAVSHSFIEQAVRRRYLADGGQEASVHRRLAEYFSGSDEPKRVREELPWQYLEAGEWHRLANLLGDPHFLLGLLGADSSFDLTLFWRRIEGHSSIRAIDQYAQVIRNPDLYSMVTMIALAQTFSSLGHHAQGARLLSSVATAYVKYDDIVWAQAFLNEEIQLLLKKGEYDTALGLADDLVALTSRVADVECRVNALTVQAAALMELGRLSEARRVFEECAMLSRAGGEWSLAARSLGNQAVIMMRQGERSQVDSMLSEAMILAREGGDEHVIKSIRDLLVGRADSARS